MKSIHILATTWYIIGATVCLFAKAQTATITGGPRISQAAAEADTEAYRKVIELNRVGKDAVMQGKYTQGEALYRQGISIRDNWGDSWLLLADVYERQGKQAQALKAYDALFHGPGRLSSECNQSVPRIRYVLALVCGGRWQEAVAIYEQTRGIFEVGQHFNLRIVERPRLLAAAHLFLAPRVDVYAEGGANERLKHFQEAVRLRPRWALALYKYGEELDRTQRLPEARAAYTRAFAVASAELKPRVGKALEYVKGRKGAK